MSHATAERVPAAQRLLPRLNGWLLWKEARLLAPLFVSMLVFGFVLVGGQYAFANPAVPRFRSSLEILLVMIPGLFATGLGAVLVGQERERGTVDWQATLPISPSKFALTKVLVGAIGLLAIWVMAGIAIETIGVQATDENRWQLRRNDSHNREITPIQYPVWIAHSFYIMCCGFFASWRIKNQFQSLVSIVFLAALPFVLTEILAQPISQWQHIPIYDAEPLVFFYISATAIPLMFLLGLLTAIKALSPQSGSNFVMPRPDRISVPSAPAKTSQAPLLQAAGSLIGLILAIAAGLIAILMALTFVPLFGSSPFLWFVIIALGSPLIFWLGYRAAMKQVSSAYLVTERARVVVVPGEPPFGSQIAPLIWQYARSSPGLLAVLIVLVVLGSLIPLSNVRGNFTNVMARAQYGWLAFLGVSWLAVLVFKGDGDWERVKFLADRGVAPRKIWLARHSIPVALISGMIVIYTMRAIYTIEHHADQESTFAFSSMAMTTFVAVVVYSVSQWLSQLIRGVTLSVIVAPAVSLMAVSWSWFAWDQLNASAWSIGASALLPLLATLWLMPRYVDSRDRPHAFVIGAAVTALVVILPLTSARLDGTSHLNMSSERRQSLLANGDAHRARIREVIELSVSLYPHPELPADSPRIEQVLQSLRNWPDSPEELIPELKELHDRPESVASMSLADWGPLFDRLMLQRVILENAVADEADDLPDALEDFGIWIESTSLLASSLRRSVNWSDQEIADRLEIWLVDTLSSSLMNPYRTEDFYRSAVKRLPDKNARNAARRAAVLASWARWFHQDDRNKGLMRIGGIEVGGVLGPSSPTIGTAHTQMEAVVLAALHAAPDHRVIKRDDVPWDRHMHDLIIGSSVPFESGSYAPRFRAIPAMMSIRLIPPGNKLHYLHPARFWGMKWEKKAEALRVHAQDKKVDAKETSI